MSLSCYSYLLFAIRFLDQGIRVLGSVHTCRAVLGLDQSKKTNICTVVQLILHLHWTKTCKQKTCSAANVMHIL